MRQELMQAVRMLCGFALLCAVLEMLLPEGTMKRYAHFACALSAPPSARSFSGATQRHTMSCPGMPKLSSSLMFCGPCGWPHRAIPCETHQSEMGL